MISRAALLFSAAALAFSGQAVAERPNLILCMTDDQGWGDVSYNGLREIATSNLDAMAASGLRFNRFYSAAPVCSPTRGSVLTGRHPNRYGCFLYGYPLRREERTIAQAVKAAGYATGHFGKWHLNGVSGPGKPIPADDPLHPGRFGFDEWLSVSNFFDLDPPMSRNGTTVELKGDGSDLIVEEALGFIGRAVEAKKPFLAVVWFGNPHGPHRALPSDREKAGGSDYYGEILGIDRAMGRLRSELRRRGIHENTLVWFTSDNGATGPGSTGGLRGKKGSVWEGGVRVPGIVEWPARIRKPAATDVAAVSSDITPTILDLLGLKPPDPAVPLDGVSLLPLFDGKMSERPRPIGFWHYGPKKGETGLPKDAGQAAWTDNRYKLLKLGPAKFELYDLLADRDEKTDLASQEPEVAARMKAELDAWQESVLRSYRGEDYKPR
jgi:arylsulfatase A-like enzyme